jgi:type IV pilus assembly protein PilA
VRDKTEPGDSDQRGFTLIELMVVVLIIAILIAIAIPTFLGAKQRAQDKAAQSSLRNALTNAKALYTDTNSYTGATVAAMGTSEPSLQFVDLNTVSTGPKMVSLDPVPGGATDWLIMTAKSTTGVCFVIGDSASQAASAVFGRLDSAGACSGAQADTTFGHNVVSMPSTPNATVGGGWAQAW